MCNVINIRVPYIFTLNVRPQTHYLLLYDLVVTTRSQEYHHQSMIRNFYYYYYSSVSVSCHTLLGIFVVKNPSIQHFFHFYIL